MVERRTEAAARGPDRSEDPGPRIDAVIAKQRALFESGVTLPRAYREEQLRALMQAVARREEQLMDALRRDLGRPDFEAYLTAVGLVLGEIRHTLKHLGRWMRPRKHLSPVTIQPAISRIHYQPLGVNLIVGPWNYPINLVLIPLIGALAAGNTAVLKPSEVAPASAAALVELVADTFPEDLVAVFEGGVDVAQALLQRRWDHIFFTGGTKVGRIVAHAGAEHLSRVTLELGGKSPTIVMDSADLDVAARRICSGKFINAGQTCLAPDYLLVHESIHDALLQRIASTVRAFYGDDPQKSPHYGRMINDHHFERVRSLIDPDKVVLGGDADPRDRYIAPTVMRDVELDDKVMAEEIFGPVLPTLKIRRIEDAIEIIRRRPNPLALYLFTSSPEDERRIVDEVSFGGGCINATVSHFGDPDLPFGGIGTSGIGSYHGFYSFEVFSHRKSVVKAGTFLDLDIRYPPYVDRKMALLRRILR